MIRLITDPAPTKAVRSEANLSGSPVITSNLCPQIAPSRITRNFPAEDVFSTMDTPDPMLPNSEARVQGSA